MLSFDLEGPKTEVEKAILDLKKTFFVREVRMPHKVVLLDDWIRQRVIVELREIEQRVIVEIREK